MKKTIINSICLFDTHPAFEGYECPFIHSDQISVDCKELGCPLYKEEIKEIEVDVKPQKKSQ